MGRRSTRPPGTCPPGPPPAPLDEAAGGSGQQGPSLPLCLAPLPLPSPSVPESAGHRCTPPRLAQPAQNPCLPGRRYLRSEFAGPTEGGGRGRQVRASCGGWGAANSSAGLSAGPRALAQPPVLSCPVRGLAAPPAVSRCSSADSRTPGPAQSWLPCRSLLLLELQARPAAAPGWPSCGPGAVWLALFSPQGTVEPRGKA